MEYVPKYFHVRELVPMAMYERWSGMPSRLWCLFDPRLLITLDRIRERFGQPITINDWSLKGRLQYCGWRPESCKIGAALSQHKWGRAADLHWSKLDPEEVRRDIRDNPKDPAYEFIACVEEDTPTWLHIDVRNWDRTQSGILWIQPS